MQTGCGSALHPGGEVRAKSVKLGQYDSLNHVVTLSGACAEILFGFAACQTVEQFPCGVSDQKIRLSVCCRQIPLVFGNL